MRWLLGKEIAEDAPAGLEIKARDDESGRKVVRLTRKPRKSRRKRKKVRKSSRARILEHLFDGSFAPLISSAPFTSKIE